MKSPTSRYKRKPRKYRKREHHNKKFYNSKAWRETRTSYIRAYQQKIYKEVTKGYWTVSGTRLDLSPHQVTRILSLSYVPCEQCLKLYCAEVYETIEEGVELDHIERVNPKDALDRVMTGVTAISSEYKGDMAYINGEVNYLFGDPFSHDNLQLLCKRHHARKSQRETNN